MSAAHPLLPGSSSTSRADTALRSFPPAIPSASTEESPRPLAKRRSRRMMPRAPGLFRLEEGMAMDASTSAPAAMAAAAGDLQLVGLRLIIQPSPRKQQLPAVLRKSAVRIINPAATSAAKCHDDSDRVFAGLEFLKRCSCCHRDLDATMDVFVYKGEQGFCSAECRCRHIAREERREMEMLVRKRRDAFHRRHAAAAPKMQASNRRIMLQTAAR